MRFLSIIILVLFIQFWIGSTSLSAQMTAFEQDSNTTTTYIDMIAYYKGLTEAYPEIQMEEVGMTDVGKPLHAVVVSKDQDF